MMSKRHYKFIAEIIREARTTVERSAPGEDMEFVRLAQRELLDDLTSHLSDALLEDNPRFNRTSFIEACRTG